MTERISKKSFVLIVVVLVMGLVVVGTVLANGQKPKSEFPVYWAWDFGNGDTDNPVGTSSLVRTGNGASANYKTDVLTPSNAATLWFIVFNYPENCTPDQGGCSPDDLGDTAAQGDFFIASGNVIGNSGKGNFGGHLKVGDTSGSGLSEMMGCEDCTPGFIDPSGALVVLAVHDHGPAQTGQTLKEQISSYLGGCVGDFNGNEFGFATGPGDLPDDDSECSTIQFSPHAPQ